MSVEKFFVSRDRHIDFRRFKTRDLARFNCNFYAWPSIQCLYFIYARKIYVRTHGKITRQLKFTLALSLSERLMKFFKETLTFESADQILWCDHSNRRSLPVLTHGAICFPKFHKMKFGNLVEICLWLNLALKGFRERKSARLTTVSQVSC